MSDIKSHLLDEDILNCFDFLQADIHEYINMTL